MALSCSPDHPPLSILIWAKEQLLVRFLSYRMIMRLWCLFMLYCLFVDSFCSESPIRSDYHPHHLTAIKLLSFFLTRLKQRTQKCDRFWLIHILLYRFNPIRCQLETALNFWLVNLCVKECELITGGHTYGLLAVKLQVGCQKNNFFLVLNLWLYHQGMKKGLYKTAHRHSLDNSILRTNVGGL